MKQNNLLMSLTMPLVMFQVCFAFALCCASSAFQFCKPCASINRISQRPASNPAHIS